MNNLSNIISERFWSKVSVRQKLRCWPWLGATNTNGYGHIKVEGVLIISSRVAFWLRNGVWPENACHSCDNPICCNPDHIFNGTHLENMQDMAKKGRSNPVVGELHPFSKLTDEKVRLIRGEYKKGETSMSKLAVKYSCSFSLIQRVIREEVWRHIK